MKNNNQKVITRFAPSPTGVLHIGGVRTALFNYLFAKQNNGKIILRIEDTDKERSKKEYEDNIIESFRWLGLTFDEFFRQSDREGIHKRYLEKIITEGKAYYSKEEIKEEGQRAEVIRFKNPNKKVKFYDMIRGDIEFDTTELGDFVIAKSINEPIFHLAVVIDDFEMGITHIIRGEEHISNTPRQILIQEAIGAPMPIYGHLPLILAEDRAKLSKRKHGEMTSTTYYKKMGYIPEAVLNFVALLGWNPGNNIEIMSLVELIDKFDITKVQKGGAIFNKEKLAWVNKEYIKLLPHSIVKEEVKKRLPENYSDERMIEKIIPIVIERINILSDIEEMVKNGDLEYYFNKPEVKKEMLVWKKGGTEKEASENLFQVENILINLFEDKFSVDDIKAELWKIAEEKGKGNVLWPLRVALSGKEKSPDPFTLSAILGKTETLTRIKHAINLLKR